MSTRADQELNIVTRIMRALGELPPVAQTRVLDYVVSRVESAAVPEPTLRNDPRQVPMFPSQEERRAAHQAAQDETAAA